MKCKTENLRVGIVAMDHGPGVFNRIELAIGGKDPTGCGMRTMELTAYAVAHSEEFREDVRAGMTLLDAAEYSAQVVRSLEPRPTGIDAAYLQSLIYDAVLDLGDPDA